MRPASAPRLPARTTALATVTLCLALGALGCARRRAAATQPTPEQRAAMENAYATPLVDPSEIGGDFMMEQEVRMTHPRGEHTFRSVLQKAGDELILLGLAPHGGRAFVLRQVGQEVSFESFMPEELPFPARFMLHDIHRTWFLGSGVLDAVDGIPDGEQTQTLDTETITERWSDGQLMSRTYAREREGETQEIVVSYGERGLEPGAPSTAGPPAEVRFDNGWFGYEARIRTLSWQRL